MRLFTAIFHDDENEVQVDYPANSFAEAVQYAQPYCEELGDGWGLVSLAHESFEFESLRRLGVIAPELAPDIHAPEFGE